MKYLCFPVRAYYFLYVDSQRQIASETTTFTYMCLDIAQLVGNNAKRQISKRVLQENEVHQILGDKECLFFRKFGVLCFLVTPGFRFALFPYYRRTIPKLA